MRSCPGSIRGGLFPAVSLYFPPRLLPRFFRRLPWLRRRELYTGLPRFGQPNGDGLFRRTPAVLAFADMLYFSANEFPRLGSGRFPFARILPRSMVLFSGIPCLHK